MNTVTQVSRVTDVVSVGQQLTLMCIGQDVRGNIKLSLKSTSPRLESKRKNAVENSIPVQKEASHVWESSSDESDEEKQELPINTNNTSKEDSSTSSIPAILIRSVAECDEEEKSSGFHPSFKSRHKSSAALKDDEKEKLLSILKDGVDSPLSILTQLSASNPKKSKSSLKNRRKKASNGTIKLQDGAKEDRSNSPSDTQRPSSEEDTESKVTTRNLKLGTTTNAKVYQVRAHGLVLDLGNGIHGMYRFEVRFLVLLLVVRLFMTNIL